MRMSVKVSKCLSLRDSYLVVDTDGVGIDLRSDGPGVFGILDTMNGRTLCGCNTVTACQPGSPFGVCKNVPAPTVATPTSSFTGSFSGSVQLTGYAHVASYPDLLFTCSIHLLLLILLFL
ncbi:hypothetical protein RND81_13G135300 [Saponaria officinalis]|uniref:Uncharacterized protein n=1 Tax=Saponaria officinalis TaxID=3572 RepID=A0AAW1H137_SAPOF